MNERDDIIERDGERYKYAGQFRSLWAAYDYIDALKNYGEIGDDEKAAFVDHQTCAVYVLAPPLAPS